MDIWIEVIICLVWAIGGSILVCKVICPISASKPVSMVEVVHTEVSTVRGTTKNWWLISASVLATIHIIYVMYNMGNLSLDNKIAGAIGLTIIAPHLFLVVVGTIFSIIATVKNHKALAITAAIIFSVSTCLYFLHFINLIPLIVCTWLGWYKVKKS